MTASFQTVQANIILNRYNEPLSTGDIQVMSNRDDEYASSHPGPIYVIADFTGIKSFPTGLLTIGVRPSMHNPVRNPKIASIIVICESPFLIQLASMLSRVTRIQKLIVVRNFGEAEAELHKRGTDYNGHGSSPTLAN